MYNHSLHQQINQAIQQQKIDIAGRDNLFFTRFIANATAIDALFHEIYGKHPRGEEFFNQLISLIAGSYTNRPAVLKQRDEEKEKKETGS